MEEETKEEVKPEETKEPEKPSFLKDAHTARDEIRAENERMEKNIAELKELRAEQIISGTTDAGQKQEVKEETAAEYKERVLHGEL